MNMRNFTLIVICLISILGAKPAHAQLGVPIGTDTDRQSIMNYLKNFTLDKLASIAAKQILHQMTVSTVNWINGGFNGSPAFLTNPEGFFLDVADQMTGEFIAGNGALQGLCSPWSVDIRLTLALNQSYSGRGYGNGRYYCTLDRIIGNAENASINGFIGGDFRQGGWPAFLAMTTDPRNNPYGSYLQAQSDLYQQIADKKAEVNSDLDRGSGFLSYKSCAGVQVSGPLGMQVEQKCSTQTPGSVLVGTLLPHLNSGTVQLELANDINSVVNALVSQLLNQMLSKGLRSLSSGGSGVNGYTRGSLDSYISQLQTQATSPQTAGGGSLPPIFNGGGATQPGSAAGIYSQAVSLLSGSKSQLEGARSCFLSKSAQSATVQNSLGSIDGLLMGQVNPLLLNMQAKQANATQVQQPVATVDPTVPGTTDPNFLAGNINTQIQNYTDAVNGLTTGSNDNPQAIAAAQQDLNNVRTQTTSFNQQASTFFSICSSTP